MEKEAQQNELYARSKEIEHLKSKQEELEKEIKSLESSKQVLESTISQKDKKFVELKQRNQEVRRL